MKKPLIGITSSYSSKGEIGKISHLGAESQQWQLLADDYILAIEKAGGLPVIIPITENPESVLPILKNLDGIIFTGGNDIDPCFYHQTATSEIGEISTRRDAVDILLLKEAITNYKMPILGICRGCQILNVGLGGSLFQDLKESNVTEMEHFLLSYPIDHTPQRAHLKPNSRLQAIFGTDEIGINSFHHQAVDKPGENLKIVAKSEDGVVEAIEMRGDRFVMGVQWHPEMLQRNSNNHSALFEHFVSECVK